MPGGFGVGFGEIYRGGGRVVFYICHLWTWKDGVVLFLEEEDDDDERARENWGYL